MSRRPTNVTEAGEQKAVVEFCRLSRIPVVHIANEGKRSVAYGRELAALGMSKGFPDLFFPEARKGFHGLFIEMKRDRNSSPTREQREWLARLNGNGYRAIVSYGADEAIAEIRSYFGIK